MKNILKLGKPATSLRVEVTDQWVLRGAARAAASHGHVEVLAYASLTPAGAREYARRILTAAADADDQTTTEQAPSAAAAER